MNPIILDSNLVKTVITNSNDTLLIVFNQLSRSNYNIDNYIVTILVTLLAGTIALIQVRGNTISSARITWIENFRNSVAEYCMNSEKTVMQILNMDFKAKNFPNAIYVGFYKDNDAYVQYSSEATKYSLKIKLYLNLEEAKPKRIEELINKIDNDLVECYGSSNKKQFESEIKMNLKEITRISNIIIKEEWEKAKLKIPKIK